MSIRGAVIGVGAMGRHHARVLADMPGVTLVAVADTHLADAEEIARRYHCQAYADPVRLLEESRLDLAVVTVPTLLHLEIALQVIERRIPLLVEKPIAFSVEEGQAMIAAAHEAGVPLMVGHIERFNPAVMALKERIGAGELGRVFQIDARRQGPFPARVQDVGVVIDLAVHDLDVMRFVTGAEVNRVYAETERRVHSSREDLLSGLVRLDDGTVGTLMVNWLTPTKIRELHVTGELGMFRVDYLTQDLYFFENGTIPVGEWPLRILRGVSEGRMIRHVVPKKEPLRAELEEFVAALQGRSQVPVTGPDGLRALELAQAIVRSGLEHQAVAMA
jgi:predicted dehydrogenase